MTSPAVDWSSVRLVVFGVEGVLYDPGKLRWRMARDMALHTLTRRSLRAVRVVARYRSLRDRHGTAGPAVSQTALIIETAAATGVPADEVRRIAQDWLERRPLRHLAACRAPGVAAVMDGMRRAGLTVTAWSDAPVLAKLDALRLTAEFMVCAGDPGVGLLKPDPRGLHVLMAQACVSAEHTILIGAAPDLDGEAARKAGVRVLIRSSRPWPGWECFTGFDDPVFPPFV